MKKTIVCLFALVAILSCNTIQQEKEPDLKGYWAFLDQYGNYNEALFEEHYYTTVNRFVMEPPRFRYQLKNDSLWTNNDRRKEGLAPIASLVWLNNDRIVINAAVVSDTLERIQNPFVTLADTDPKGDSAIFWPAFYARYEKFLIKKGIITEDEAEAFRKNQQIPEDVKPSMTE